MRLRLVVYVSMLVFVLSAFGSSFAATSDPSILTDDPEVNEQIKSGEITVRKYVEPSAARKKEILRELETLGYLADQVSAFPWPIKDFIATNKLAQSEAQQSIMFEGAGEGTSESEIAPMNMENWMSWTRWPGNTGDLTENRITMWTAFDWYDMPFWRLEEKIGYQWAADDTWALKQINVIAFHEACNHLFSQCQTFQVTSTTPVESTPGGAGVKFPLVTSFTVSGRTYETYDVYGSSFAVVRRPKNGGTDRRMLVYDAEYAHKQGACSFSLTFSLPPSIGVGISCSWLHDITDTPTDYIEYLP